MGIHFYLLRRYVTHNSSVALSNEFLHYLLTDYREQKIQLLDQTILTWYMISEFTSGRLLLTIIRAHVKWKHGFTSFNENVNV